MADIFLLTDKQKRHIEKVYGIIVDALNAVGAYDALRGFNLTDEQLQTVSDIISDQLSPLRQAQQATKILATPYFSLVYVPKSTDTGQPAPADKRELRNNEFFLGDQLYTAHNEWYFVRSDSRVELAGLPVMETISEDSEAYNLLGATPTPTPPKRTEEETARIRGLLGLDNYSYVDLAYIYRLKLIQFICYEVAEIGNGAAAPSASFRNAITPQPSRDFYRTPEGVPTDLILSILGAGRDGIDELGDSKKRFNRGQKITVSEKNNSRLVTLENSKGSVSVSVTDIDKLTKSNKTAKKLFVFAITKANEQAIHSGELSRNYVSFPLQELVDIGFYRSVNSARAGFNSGTDALTSIKVKGQTRRGKKNTINSSNAGSDALEVLFTGSRIENNQCFIFLNERINWGFIAEYFTILPLYAFGLPNRAFDLLFYIFYLARQHTKDIAEKGYFTIGFRAIQQRLHLPDEKGLNNPQRDIKDAILVDAIEPIEDKHHAMYNNGEFHLTPYCNETLPATAFLDEGYLKVELTGSYAQSFVEISQKAAQMISDGQKRRERQEDRARALALAEKIKQDTPGKIKS